MPSSFPGAIDNFTDPLAGSPLNSPSHSGQHSDLNDAVEKIETYMGLVKVIPTGATNGTVSADGDVTIGNAVASVTVSGAFSSLYDSYKVIVSGGTSSASQSVAVRMGATTAGYYLGLTSTLYSTAAFYATGTTNNGANFGIAGWADTDIIAVNFELGNPFLAKRTYINATVAGTNVGGFAAGYLANTTSYTDFSLIVTGTLTGGTIRVYGYRN